MIETMIQPMLSSMIAEARMTWPTMRRMKFISRTTIATILTEAIDSAVPRNSEVISRLSGSGSIESGRNLAEREAAGERHENAHQRGEDRGAAGLAHQPQVGLHAGEQQQQQDAELRDGVDHRLLLGRARKERVLDVREQRAEQRRPEHEAGDQLAHHGRLADPQHGLAEQPADDHQDDELDDEDPLGRPLGRRAPPPRPKSEG